MPFTIEHPVFAETEIKKSRFMAWVEPVENGESAKDRIAELKREYPDARHVCFAFYVQGNSGMSDDGEPSGTAGKPMFNVINHKNLVNVLAVVVRYFGGIKLGAGGLARAYGGAVSQALTEASFQKVDPLQPVHINFPFALESHLRRVLEQKLLVLRDIVYSDSVQAWVEVPASQITETVEAIQAVAPGNSDLVVRVAD